MRLIDADAAMKRLKAWDTNDATDKALYNFALNRVLEAPTIEERKRGRWLSHYDYCKKHGYIPSGVIAFWWCDQCEQGVEHTTNYCPNCGADMRERKENRDGRETVSG